jgi:hypothetical protein
LSWPATTAHARARDARPSPHAEHALAALARARPSSVRPSRAAAQNGSTDATGLAVACYDLGCFIQYHADGRKIVASMGAKAPLMGLLTHADAAVQKYALSTTQKLMVMNWEMLAK